MRSRAAPDSNHSTAGSPRRRGVRRLLRAAALAFGCLAVGATAEAQHGDHPAHHDHGSSEPHHPAPAPKHERGARNAHDDTHGTDGHGAEDPERTRRIAVRVRDLHAPFQALGTRAGNDDALLLPIVGLLPIEALEELEAGAEAVRSFQRARDRTHRLASRDQGGFVVEDAAARIETPRPRPPRCPRWLAAVFVDAESGLDPAALMQRDPRDLLVLRNPGPCVRAEELALLERIVEREALSLCVVLVQRGSEALLRQRDPTPQQIALERRTEAARSLASSTGADLARAHAEIEGRRVFEFSEVLANMRARGRFEVVLGIVDERGQLVEFVAPWREDPLQALRARMALRELVQEQQEARAALLRAREEAARRLEAPAPGGETHGGDHGSHAHDAGDHGASGHGSDSRHGHHEDPPKHGAGHQTTGPTPKPHHAP
jgi:hypothetical protein